MNSVSKYILLATSLIFSSSTFAFTHECLGSGQTIQGYDMEHWVYATSTDAHSYNRAGHEEELFPAGQMSLEFGPYFFWFSTTLTDGSGYNFAPGEWIWATRMHGSAVLMNNNNADWDTLIECDGYWG